MQILLLDGWNVDPLAVCPRPGSGCHLEILRYVWPGARRPMEPCNTTPMLKRRIFKSLQSSGCTLPSQAEERTETCTWGAVDCRRRAHHPGGGWPTAMSQNPNRLQCIPDFNGGLLDPQWQLASAEEVHCLISKPEGCKDRLIGRNVNRIQVTFC